MAFSGGFTFSNFVTDAFAVFMFVLWFWLLITVSGDLFRRHDISGLAKVIWVLFLIILPVIAHPYRLDQAAVRWGTGAARASRMAASAVRPARRPVATTEQRSA